MKIKFITLADKAIESKLFRISIKSAFFISIGIIALVLFMIFNFLFKIYFLDYRFDDLELKPPIETIQKE
jgi:formate-dependent nitrite reductase membrane component NrfD